MWRSAAFSDWVEAFSWDGSLALVDRGQGVGAVRLMSWRDGKVSWAAPYHWQMVGSRPQPGGGGMAVRVGPSPQLAPESQPPSLFVVTSAGTVVAEIAGGGEVYP